MTVIIAILLILGVVVFLGEWLLGGEEWWIALLMVLAAYAVIGAFIAVLAWANWMVAG